MSGQPIPFYRRRSALESYRCPRYFKARYIDQVPDASVPAWRGTTFHECARQYVSLLKQHECSDDLDLAAQAFKLGVVGSMAPAEIIAEVRELWARFTEQFRIDPASVLLAEERPDDEYSWQPDLVRVYDDVDTLDITDFKTHYVVLSDGGARSSFQAKFYAARARRVWKGFRIYRFQFWFVRWNAIVPVEFTPAELDDFDEDLRLLEASILTAIATDTFPAVPGETCQYCRLTCDAVQHPERVPFRLETPAVAVDTLGEYLALQRAADLRREALEGYAAFDGPVRRGAQEFGPGKKVRTEFPVAHVLEVFRQFGIEPQFTVSAHALAKFLNSQRLAHVGDALRRGAITKTGTEYRVRTVDATTNQQGEVCED